MVVGALEGDEGNALGLVVGTTVGFVVRGTGAFVGDSVGGVIGIRVGAEDGLGVGIIVGSKDIVGDGEGTKRYIHRIKLHFHFFGGF